MKEKLCICDDLPNTPHKHHDNRIVKEYLGESIIDPIIVSNLDRKDIKHKIFEFAGDLVKINFTFGISYIEAKEKSEIVYKKLEEWLFEYFKKNK